MDMMGRVGLVEIPVLIAPDPMPCLVSVTFVSVNCPTSFSLQCSWMSFFFPNGKRWIGALNVVGAGVIATASK